VEYILLLDVDHIPKRDFLRDLILVLEEDQSLSFIQTPQFFTSGEMINCLLFMHFNSISSTNIYAGDWM